MTWTGATVTADHIGWLSEAQMIEVDRVMIEDLHIELVQMMENAGRQLAELVIRRYQPKHVAVLVGSGGNGGGGLVAARHLSNRGVDVTVIMAKPPERLGPVPAHQFDIVTRMGLPQSKALVGGVDVVIDAMIGYSLKGAPRGRTAELISQLSDVDYPVVSLDTPSGLNVTDGSHPGAVVQADATVTLALPKLGLRLAPQVGELWIADISVPPSVYTAMRAGPAPDFSSGGLVQVIGR